MNILNRLLVVIALLAALVLSCASLVVVLFARTSLTTTFQPLLSALAGDFGLPQLFCMGVAILVFAVAVLLLYLELVPSNKVNLRVKSIQGADVSMSSDAITTQLQYALDPLPGVLRATPRVLRGKGDSVDVLVDMTTTADVDVQAKTAQVTEVAHSVLEGGLGLRLGKLQIKIDQIKPPKKGSVVTAPLDLPKLISRASETDEPPK